MLQCNAVINKELNCLLEDTGLPVKPWALIEPLEDKGPDTKPAFPKYLAILTARPFKGKNMKLIVSLLQKARSKFNVLRIEEKDTDKALELTSRDTLRLYEKDEVLFSRKTNLFQFAQILISKVARNNALSVAQKLEDKGFAQVNKISYFI